MWRIYCNHLTEAEKLRFRLEFISGDCENHSLSHGRNVINRATATANTLKEQVTLLGNLQPVIDSLFNKAAKNVEDLAIKLDERNTILANYINNKTPETEAQLKKVVNELFDAQTKGAFVQWKVGKVLPDRSELFRDIRTLKDAISALSVLIKTADHSGLLTNTLDTIANLLGVIAKGNKRV